jgi:nucleotide-binding universal stress UspA family protein
MPRSILAAIDLAVSSDQVLAAAKEYSEAFSAKVYLVHVAEPGPISEAALMILSSEEEVDLEPEVKFALDRKAEADRLRAERHAFQDLRRKLSEAGVDATAIYIEGPTVDKLLLEIDRLDIDLVIIGSHAPSFLRDLFLGSTTKEVVRDALCPVLVLPPAGDEHGPI